jgi:hypothetical protein
VAAWRERNAEEEEADRLRRRLRPASTKATAGSAPPSEAAPLGRLDVVAARNAVGLQMAVFVEEMARELIARERNAADAQLSGIKGRSGGHGGPSGRKDPDRNYLINPWNFAYGDFGRDGDTDLTILDLHNGCDPYPEEYDPAWHRIGVLLADSETGLLTLGGWYPMGTAADGGVHGLWAHDVDRDDLLDLVAPVEGRFGRRATVLRGHADGSFVEGETVDLSPDLASYALRGAGDFDGDGSPEWVALHDDTELSWIVPTSLSGLAVRMADPYLEASASVTVDSVFGDLNDDDVDDYLVVAKTQTDPVRRTFLMLSAP